MCAALLSVAVWHTAAKYCAVMVNTCSGCSTSCQDCYDDLTPGLLPICVRAISASESYMVLHNLHKHAAVSWSLRTGSGLQEALWAVAMLTGHLVWN